MSIYIHESAVVDDGARIGEGSKIWHFSHVSQRAILGNNVTIGQNVYIANNVKVGSGSKVQNNVSIYDNVFLDEDVFCGPSMVFTNVNNPRANVERKDEYRDTTVQKGATLGANCTVVCGVNIGRYAFIGAGAVVTRDVADFALMVGNPARRVGWMSVDGVRLALPLVGDASCEHDEVEYRLIGGKVSIWNS